MMTTLAWVGAGMGRYLTGRESGRQRCGKCPERHDGAAENVKSKSKVCGQPCKNCNSLRRIFPTGREVACCARNKIAQLREGGLRELLGRATAPEGRKGNPNSRAEESRRDRSQNPERDPGRWPNHQCGTRQARRYFAAAVPAPG